MLKVSTTVNCSHKVSRKRLACTFEALQDVLFQALHVRTASVEFVHLLLHVLQCRLFALQRHRESEVPVTTCADSFDGKAKHAVAVNIVEGIRSE